MVREPDQQQGPFRTTNKGDRAVYRFLEFFAARIRNKNTRTVYERNALHFFSWVDYRGRCVQNLTSMHVAAYIKEISPDLSRTSVKQHLASIRMLYAFGRVEVVLGMDCDQ
jgi:site-specific recombinase XerD